MRMKKYVQYIYKGWGCYVLLLEKPVPVIVNSLLLGFCSRGAPFGIDLVLWWLTCGTSDF